MALSPGPCEDSSWATAVFRMKESSIINIAGYHFSPLQKIGELRQQLLRHCKEWNLRGTILLASEGINLFVAGAKESVDALMEVLRNTPGLGNLQVKYSVSDHQPFNRMLVRLKKEIIAFGVDGIDPSKKTSPKLPARQLKQWLDEKRDIILYDTRNDYEVKLGTFENALPAGIRHFRDFPRAVRALPSDWKDKPIVMFCTGGIRCEKAGPFMESEGFKEVYQLEGGILKYFEECGGEHYQGECFVFDQRVGLDPGLRETGSDQCFQCLTPLTAAETQHPHYVAGVSCPYCFKTDSERMRGRVDSHHAKLRQLTSPLPGSVPYENFRPMNIPAECEGWQLAHALSRVVKHLGPDFWSEECCKGLVLDLNRKIMGSDHVVRGGERYLHRFPSVVEPAVNGDIRILYEDDAILVLSKPAPLPMHAGGRFNRNTLQYLIQELFYPAKPKPAHRLDANTTGLVVFSMTRAYASQLQPQFLNGKVEKEYLLLVNGMPNQDSFECRARIGAEAGISGARTVGGEDGLEASTLFRVLERHPANHTALLVARPLTGRTNQIRLHATHLGFPIVGDQFYGANSDMTVETPATLGIQDPPMCLHSWRMSFDHPKSRKRVMFEAPSPRWANVENT